MAQSKRVFTSATEAVPTVLERGAHHRVEEWTERLTLDDGSTQDVVHTYTVLATGMHWRDSGDAQWQETVAEFVPVSGGFVAERGPHRVAVSDDLLVEGAVTVVSPEGNEWRSTPLSLALRDRAGVVVVLANSRSTRGELVNPDTIVFNDAFEGISASVRVVYSAAGVECDVVVHERLPDVTLLGLDAASTEMVVLTEVYGTTPTALEHHAEGAAGVRTDATLHLGSLRLDRGRAFSVSGKGETGGPEAAVMKELYEQDGRIFLEEAVRLDELAPLLDTLPGASLPSPFNDRWRDTAESPSPIFRAPYSGGPTAVHLVTSVPAGVPARPTRAAAFTRRADGHFQVAVAGRSAHPQTLAAVVGRPGAVLDWSYVNSSTMSFLAGQTYFVTGPVMLNGGPVRFEGSAVIKYAPSGNPSISISSGTEILWEGRPYSPVILTARDDNSVGDAVTGSTGTPSGVYADRALSLSGSGRTTPLVLANLHVRYANLGVEAVYFGPAGPLTVRHAQFVNCGGAVKFQLGNTGAETYFLQNVLVANSTTLFKDFTIAHTRADFITVNNVTNLRQTQYNPLDSNINLYNSVLTAVGGVTGANNCYVNASATGVYASLGAGDHYLASASPARYSLDTGAGKASQPLTAVASDAALATTTAPLPLATTYSGNHSLSAWSGTGDQWTRGYHYWPLDYAAIGTTTTYASTISGGTVTVKPGGAPDAVRMGFGGPKGIRIEANGTMAFDGTSPGERLLTHRLVRLTAVQENPTATAAKVSSSFLFQLEQSGVLSVRSAEVSLNTAPPGVRTLMTMATGAYAPMARFRDVWFRRASWSVAPAQASIWPSVGLTNCVLDSCAITLANAWGPGTYDRAPLDFQFRNNRMFQGTLTLTCYSTHVANWAITDNLFEATTILAGSYAGPNSYNAFSAATGFPNNGTATRMNVAMNWVTLPDGRQYYPTADTAGNDLYDLRNAGTGGGVTARGLRYHTTDGPPEGATVLDIGFHYPAGIGDQWMDTDSDGLADAAEDVNGDGVVNTGESNPANADSDQDGAMDGEEVAAGTLPTSKTNWLPKRLAAWWWDAAGGAWKQGDRGQPPTQQGTEFPTTGIVGNGVHLAASPSSPLRYALQDANGRLNVRLDNGSIRLWYKPDWTWANRPVNGAHLFSIGQPYNANLGYWGWTFGPDAAGDYRFRFGQANAFSLYPLPMVNGVYTWSQPQWYELAMNYRTRPNPQVYGHTWMTINGEQPLWVDGGTTWSTGFNLVESGMPTAAGLAQGFSLGADYSGNYAVNGSIDSVETFNYPIGAPEAGRRQQLTCQIEPGVGLKFIRDYAGQDPAFGTAIMKAWPLTLWRRVMGTTSWGIPMLVTSTAETFTDTGAQVGTTYEYKAQFDYIRCNVSNPTSCETTTYVRHFVAGIERPPRHQLGHVILLVEGGLKGNLTTELDQLQTHLIGDGWTVTNLSAPLHNDINWSANAANRVIVEGLIAANDVPGVNNVVFIIGHVTIPYSGTFAVDGHTDTSYPPDHRGAWTADAYYGYVSKTAWTDSGTAPNNTPGDGKFDPDLLAGSLASYKTAGHAPDYAVGRIDFANLPVFAPLTEVDLTRRYLAKDFRYRTNGIPTFGRVSSNLRSASSIYGLNSAQSFAGAAFGVESGRVFNGNNLRDMVPADLGVHYSYATELDAGVDDGLGASHNAASFADPTQEIPVTFRNVWFSYASDWARLGPLNTVDYPNNWLRASLGWVNYGLATMGGFNWDFSPLGAGAPLSETMRVWESQPYVWRFQSILGDPTLRLFRVSPPTALKFSRNGSAVNLSWSPPSEPVLGYYVYRSVNGLDGFSTPLNSVPVVSPVLTDTIGTANLLYQIRAVKLQITGSGSFYNLSHGIFITVP